MVVRGLLVFVLAALLGLAGCVPLPDSALRPSADALQLRQMQTRRYAGIDETKLLAASAGVIQDLGFNIEESETRLGVITGKKVRSAVKAWQVGLVILGSLGGSGSGTWDKTQILRTSIVVTPAKQGDKTDHRIRVTFQQVIIDSSNNVSRARSLKKPVYYQEFFDKLSKAVFLEAQEVQ